MITSHFDPTVDDVLKTWAPRIIVQGIDYNDLIPPLTLRAGSD